MCICRGEISVFSVSYLFRHHGITNQDQVTIACELGLTVPEEYRELYPQAIIGPKPNAGYGTQIQLPQYSINNFFKHHRLNLKMTFYPLSDIEDIDDFLAQNSENDILVCCHCGTLYDSADADWGHMLVIEGVHGDKVTLLDPSPKKSYETVSLQKLLDAIEYHGVANGAGFYIISHQ